MKAADITGLLGFRLIIASLSVLLLAFALLLGNSLRLIDHHLVEQTEQRLKATEQAYHSAISGPLITQDYASLRDVLDGWLQAEDIRYIVVLSPDGRRLASAGWPEAAAIPPPSREVVGGTIHHAAFPIAVAGQQLGSLHYGLSLAFFETARHDLLIQGIIISALAAVASALVLSAIGYWLTRRLSLLAEASTRIAAGDYRTALPPGRTDEIGKLTGNFEQMASAIESRIAELAAHLNRQKAILDAVGEGIYGVDHDGRCTFINQIGASMLGYDEREVIGQSSHALFHHSYADGTPFPKEDCLLWQTVKLGSRHSSEELFWRKDGSHFPVIATAMPLAIDGQSSGAVIAFRDISDLRQASQALQESNDRLLGFINALPDVVVLKDGANRWQTINRAAKQVLQLADFPWQGKTNEQLAAERPQFATFHHAASLSDELAWQQQDIFLCQENLAPLDGEQLTSEVRKMPVFARDGSRKALMVIARDITERLHAEAELEQHRRHLEELVSQRTEELSAAKNAAEAATAAKSAFLANMSHEIRTPLNAITGMAYLIRQAGLTPEQAERLDKLESAGRHLLEIINAVLDLSKIEAGKFQFERTAVRIDRLFADLHSILSPRAESKHLVFRTEPCACTAPLLGDPTRIQQCLLNFAANAIKFTETGHVTVRASVEAEDQASVLIRFEVSDSGIGIEKEVLERLFNAFEQADNSTTRKYGGTGLGLAITRRIARLMGGDAGATSEPGQGSRFWFTARLDKDINAGEARPEPATGEAGRLIDERHRGRRILVVEDEEINQEIITEILQDVGLVVEIAEDGVSAVEHVHDSVYALAMMDMQMPRMNGLEATRRIRQEPNGTLPIIAMTANAFAEDKARCFEAGMDDFVAKPLDPEELLRTVLRWLDSGRQPG